jgi:hypothetical protein
MGMSRAERRRSVRYVVQNCTAHFQRRRFLLFFEGGTPHKGPVFDLSSHGIAFFTKRTLRPGDTILIAFEIPFEVYAVPAGFKLKARVRWMGKADPETHQRRIGCEFRRLKPDEHELITRIIRFGILRER